MSKLWIVFFIFGIVTSSFSKETPNTCKRIYSANTDKVCAKILFYSEQLDTGDYGGNIYFSKRNEVKERLARVVLKALNNDRFMEYHRVDENFVEKIEEAESVFFSQVYLDMPFIQIYTLNSSGEVGRFKVAQSQNIAIDWFFEFLHFDFDDLNDSFDVSSIFGFEKGEKLVEEDLF